MCAKTETGVVPTVDKARRNGPRRLARIVGRWHTEMFDLSGKKVRLPRSIQAAVGDLGCQALDALASAGHPDAVKCKKRLQEREAREYRRKQESDKKALERYATDPPPEDELLRAFLQAVEDRDVPPDQRFDRATLDEIAKGRDETQGRRKRAIRLRFFKALTQPKRGVSFDAICEAMRAKFPGIPSTDVLRLANTAVDWGLARQLTQEPLTLANHRYVLTPNGSDYLHPDDKTLGKPASRSKDPPKRGWKQEDLDDAIWKLTADGDYQRLLKRYQKGDSSAKNEARALYGRNAIARRLGVNDPKMVGKSPAWTQIADDFDIPLQRDRSTGVAKRKKVGLDIAEEEKAESRATDDAPDRRLEEKEELAALERKARDLPEPQRDAILKAVRSEGMSPKEAQECIKTLQDGLESHLERDRRE